MRIELYEKGGTCVSTVILCLTVVKCANKIQILLKWKIKIAKYERYIIILRQHTYFPDKRRVVVPHITELFAQTEEC